MSTRKKSVNYSHKSLAFLEGLTGRKITVGNLLWSIREGEEMSQVEFAKALGISRQYLCDLENGRRTMSPKAAAEVAIKLGYSPAYFVQVALQDELNKLGLNYDVQINEHKDAA